MALKSLPTDTDFGEPLPDFVYWAESLRETHGAEIKLWAAKQIGDVLFRLDPDSPDARLFATVPGCAGAWAEGATPEEAVSEMFTVLVDWVSLKLADGDSDIPHMNALPAATVEANRLRQGV